MGTVGGYALDLYCDHPDHHTRPLADCKTYHGQQFTGEVRAQAVASAKAAGWWFPRTSPSGRVAPLNGDRWAVCPACRQADLSRRVVK